MDRTITKEGGYSFQEKGHAHMLNGKKLTGVTTILGTLAKPALLPWVANMACDYILNHGNKMNEHSYEVLGTTIEEARKAYITIRDEAGQKGTDVHAEIENIIKSAIMTNGGYISNTSTSENPQINQFLTWAKGKKFIDSEVHCYNEEWFVGGIADMVFEFEGKLYVGDIKTSSGIYSEAFIQCGAYTEMLKGKYEVDGVCIVNLPKKGGLNVEFGYGLQSYRDCFDNLVKVYRYMALVKKTI